MDPKNSQWFKEKTAIVTGASRGIGYECALTIAERGGNVVVGDIEDCKELCNAAKDVAGTIQSYNIDVRDENDVGLLVEKANTVGDDGIDILINNAGTISRESIDSLSHDGWREVIETNLTGTYKVTKEAKSAICANQGAIVMISSLLSKVGSPDRIAYSASKGGIDSLTRSLAAELGSEGVRVNAVNPGFIKTDMTTDFEPSELEEYKEKTALNMLGEPKDVAEVVAFLASDHARFISGETILIDGGQSIFA